MCLSLRFLYQHKQQIKSDQELWCVRRIVYLYVDFRPLIVVYESNCIIIWRDFFLWSLVSIHSITTIFPENVHIKCYIRSIWYWIILYWHFIPHWFLFSYTYCFVTNNKTWCLWQKPPTCQYIIHFTFAI